MNAVELTAYRRVTRAFVDANYRDIVLVPYVSSKTNTGGSVLTEQPPRPSQRFHVGERNSGASTNTRVQGGEVNEEELSLVGYHTAVIGERDRFNLDGHEWEVIKLEVSNGYEQRAQVRRYGR